MAAHVSLPGDDLPEPRQGHTDVAVGLLAAWLRPRPAEEVRLRVFWLRPGCSQRLCGLVVFREELDIRQVRFGSDVRRARYDRRAHRDEGQVWEKSVQHSEGLRREDCADKVPRPGRLFQLCEAEPLRIPAAGARCLAPGRDAVPVARPPPADELPHPRRLEVRRRGADRRVLPRHVGLPRGCAPAPRQHRRGQVHPSKIHR
mmetsp:Transcript_69630/g.201857  ORF Transcript_69630/g.201857 Transcript_69630/m.201857 type:complete len:202 (-) Transcript_69630:298-903(-)